MKIKNKLKHILIRTFNNFKKEFIHLIYSRQHNKSSFLKNLLNLDNCDPETNGEYFFLKNYAKSFKVFFDIGANVGNYSHELLKRNPSCRVICFEPNKNLINKIKERGIKEAYPYAISNKSGIARIYINTTDSSQSSMYRKNSNTTVISISTITIDEFCKKKRINHISFVKIDTEGNELLVLKGASRMISNKAIDIIQFEYGGTYRDAKTTLKEVYGLLSKNYIIYHLNPNSLLPLRYSRFLENYRYSNWVAILRNIYK